MCQPMECHPSSSLSNLRTTPHYHTIIFSYIAHHTHTHTLTHTHTRPLPHRPSQHSLSHFLSFSLSLSLPPLQTTTIPARAQISHYCIRSLPIPHHSRPSLLLLSRFLHTPLIHPSIHPSLLDPHSHLFPSPTPPKFFLPLHDATIKRTHPISFPRHPSSITTV